MSEHDNSTQVLDRPEYDAAPPRTVKVAHLVVGLVFLGIATIWAVNTRADDWGNVTYLVPAMLVGAGVLGLVASVAGGRSGRRAARQAASTHQAEPPAANTTDVEPTETTEPTSTDTEPTTVLTDDEESPR